VQTLNETEKLLELWFSKQTSSQTPTSTSGCPGDTSNQTLPSTYNCSGDASSTLTIPNLSSRTPQIAHIPSPLVPNSTSTTPSKVPEYAVDNELQLILEDTLFAFECEPSNDSMDEKIQNGKITTEGSDDNLNEFKLILEDTLFAFEYGPSNDSMDEKIQNAIENLASPVVKKLQKRSSLNFSEERQQAEDH